jgi:WD40 repeat protein
MPTSVWIWSIQSLKPVAVIIQHSQIKTLSWHPSNPNLLLLTCHTDKLIIYQWSLDWDIPYATIIPDLSPVAKSSVRWLVTEESDQPLFIAASPTSYTIGFLEADGSTPEGRFINITEARGAETSPVKGADSPRKDITDLFDENTTSEQGQDSDGADGSTEDVDDTFHYRRQVSVAG